MKHRRNKVKREHGIIQNALQWLENLSRLPEVIDIIPGVIDVNRSSERGIVYKYETQTGCKLLLKSNGSIQEAFVVTKCPARVQEWVRNEFPADPPPPIDVIAQNNSQNARKKMSKVSSKPVVESDFKSLAQRRQSKKRSPQKVVKSNLREVVDDTLIVADRLDISTLKALKILKNSLENTKVQKPKD